MENTRNLMNPVALNDLKNKSKLFQRQLEDSRALAYWQKHAEKHMDQFGSIKHSLSDTYAFYQSPQVDKTELWNWIDQLYLSVIKKAINVHAFTADYVIRITKLITQTHKPLSALPSIETDRKFLPKFEELHPYSETDKAITRAYLKQKQGLLAKVGSVMNYNGRTDYRFKDFEVTNDATKAILRKGKSISDDFKQGKLYNVIFSGKTGRGKTMLAVAIMNDFNNNATFQSDSLIVSMAMFENILLSTINGERVKELNQLVNRMKRADLVIWDDLGSDTSMTSNLREANNMTQKVIFEIADARQGKANIITTNHVGSDFDIMYNAKIVSRLLTTNPNHIIDFNQLPDHRIN